MQTSVNRWLLKLGLGLVFLSVASEKSDLQAQNEIHQNAGEEKSKPRQNPKAPVPRRDPDEIPPNPRPSFPDVPVSPEVIELRKRMLTEIQRSPAVEIASLDLAVYQQTYARLRQDPLWSEYQADLEDLGAPPKVLHPEFIRFLQDSNQQDFERYLDEYLHRENIEQYRARTAAAIAGYGFNEVSRGALETGDLGAAASAAKLSKAALSFALDLTPVVGNIKGLVEAAIGYDLVTGDELSTAERVLAGVASLPFGNLLKGARSAAKFAVSASESLVRNADLAKAAPELAGTRLSSELLGSISRQGDSFSREFARLTEGLDPGGSVLDRFSPEQVADLSKSFRESVGRMDLKQGAQSLSRSIGDDRTLELVNSVDPIIGLKAIQDIGASERLTGKILTADQLPRVFDELSKFNSRLMSGEAVNIALKVPNPAAFEAIRAGKLTPSLSRQTHYTQKELFNPAIGRHNFGNVSRSAGISLDGASRLVPEGLNHAGRGLPSNVDYVVPVLEGSLDTSRLMPSSYRGLAKASSDGSVRTFGELSDTAFDGIRHEGLSSLSYLQANGGVLKLGQFGDRYLRGIPDATHWSENALSYQKEFVGGSAGIRIEVLGPGDFLIRNHDGLTSKNNPAGRWFGRRRFNSAEEAEAALDVKRFENLGSQQDLYIVTEKLEVYSGRNIGSASGNELQIFVPDRHIISNYVEINDVMKRVHFDIQ